MGYILSAVLVALCAPACAQMACAPRDEIIKTLSDKYSESTIAMGLSNTGGVVEVLSSDRTWTIIVTDPSGISCLVHAGEYWEGVQMPGLSPVHERDFPDTTIPKHPDLRTQRRVSGPIL